MNKKILILWGAFVLFSLNSCTPGDSDLLSNLGRPLDFRSKRISSYDRSGGNNDRLSIPPGETAVLAEIAGPAAIHHIWVTISAEPFYGRKIILRLYWDGEENPSVEAPLGDFFGVGHGLNRSLSSLPIANSSEGRARNCYWYMPFRRSALITATNEGTQTVGAFYYYVDFRELKRIPRRMPYFHAQYRQEMPCTPGINYLIFDAEGRGHYVGCNLSILQRAMGWWGEGDDMIFIDGEEFPSLSGTGSEDYFSDAWGMREDENLFYGCPLQEPDFKTGAKATVYRFHIPDPIPFRKSIRVTIEHGHANDRSDYFSSVAYWYQSEPHKTYPSLPSVEERLPFALPSAGDIELPEWEEIEGQAGKAYRDRLTGMMFLAAKCTPNLTSFYNQEGRRYPILLTEDTQSRTTAEVSFEANFGEQHDIDLYYLRGPLLGNFEVVEIKTNGVSISLAKQTVLGYSRERALGKITLKDILLSAGVSTLVLEVTGKSSESEGMDLAFVGVKATPSRRRFITEWRLVGPFEAPDMSFLQKKYPPEDEIELTKKYRGKDDKPLEWTTVKAEGSGYVRLEDKVIPPERGLIYGLVYVNSPAAIQTDMLIGSDDGVRIWLNDRLIHTNPAYRGCYPDQDRIPVFLKKGKNKLLIKVLQGGGGWGYCVRFIDPGGRLQFSLGPDPR